MWLPGTVREQLSLADLKLSYDSTGFIDDDVTNNSSSHAKSNRGSDIIAGIYANIFTLLDN